MYYKLYCKPAHFFLLQMVKQIVEANCEKKYKDRERKYQWSSTNSKINYIYDVTIPEGIRLRKNTPLSLV